MKLFIHVQTGFCANTLAAVLIRHVLPGERGHIQTHKAYLSFSLVKPTIHTCTSSYLDFQKPSLLLS